MELLDSVMLCVLGGLLAATWVAHRAGNERRDIGLLLGLSALWGAGTAATLVWG